MRPITKIFRQVSAYLMVLSYTLDEISKIFHILHDFIKNAPDDYFENPKQYFKKSFKEIPLYLTDKGESAVKEKLSGYPHIFEATGRIQTDPHYKKAHPNFLYLVGQFLSAVATKLDYLELSKKEFYEENKSEIEKFFKIWGSKDQMNAGSLFRHFESKNNETARKEIEKKLSESSAILDKLNIKV